jgi:hypothetical protein
MMASMNRMFLFIPLPPFRSEVAANIFSVFKCGIFYSLNVLIYEELASPHLTPEDFAETIGREGNLKN